MPPDTTPDTTPDSPQRITMITLAVEDMAKSRAFYAALGWIEAEGGNDKIAFYSIDGQFFSLYSRDALTADISMPIHTRTTGSITLATNYKSKRAVNAAYQTAQDAGAVVITKPTEVFWGGYSGTFADPDGHLWEVAFNPFWTLNAKGQLEGNP